MTTFFGTNKRGFNTLFLPIIAAIVEMKSEFDALYEQFGMSANTAFNVFIKAVVRSRSIPFTIKGAPSALDLFNQQREASEAIKGQELSFDEINDEIRAARNEKRKGMF
jgi:addiction module RelB/DinJ family antitoxin